MLGDEAGDLGKGSVKVSGKLPDVLVVSITAGGKRLAERLPFRHVHGDLADTVRSQWECVDSFVLVCATGIAVRVIAPLLASKVSDSAVVCVDESGRWVVPLVGGHHGANELANDVAALLGATAVITTATDATDVVALDTLPGFVARGDLAAVAAAILDGAEVRIENPLGWPIPEALARRAAADGAPGTARVVVTDRTDVPDDSKLVRLVPRTLVVGVGSSIGASADEIDALLVGALADAGLDAAAVDRITSVDLKAHEPGIIELARRRSVPYVTFPAQVLHAIEVPNPSDSVAAIVGTKSVAEAAALIAAGPGSTLVIAKHRSAMATVAVARRARPEGSLRVVGLGPGRAAHRTPAATTAVRSADVVIGYSPYVDQCSELLTPRQDVRRRPIGAEEERCREALAAAAAGATVALVCSGDAGVYAMASLVFELAPEYGHPPIEVTPGVTAALAAAAVLGAPLGHDHASISLSDLLTPWPVIERRVRSAATGDFVVTFYNPRSLRRTRQLADALSILAEHRPPSTPVAAVTDVGRVSQRVVRSTIDAFDPTVVDMLTCVVVGSSTSRWSGPYLVTPRGYRS